MEEKYVDLAYCKECKEETQHDWHTGTHERDSSNDSRTCIECGECVTGRDKDF